MKLKMSKNTSERKQNRLTKKIRIRKTVTGTAERPRLCVFRSLNHIYAQIIDDTKKSTIVAVTSQGLNDKGNGKEVAKKVGLKIAELAKEKKISNVVFDRNGYVYHGRVQSLADGAREGGLNF